MSDPNQSDSFNQEVSKVLQQLPEEVAWAATTFPESHKEKLINMNVDLPFLSSRAVEKRRNEFYAGRWCAAQAIYQTNQCYLTPKVNADRSPLWPQSIIGSISHSKDKAISIVSTSDSYIGLGVDIQDEISAGERGEILSLILNTDEIELCQKLKITKAFELLFSAKESVYKALYPSCLEVFEHKDVQIMSVNESNSTLEIRLLRDLKNIWSNGQVFTLQYFVSEKFVLTWVCLKG